MSMPNKVKKLSEMITAYLDKIGLFEQSTVLEVYTAWSRIVGEKQAAHSKLIDIKQHTAIIETDHAGWSQQILLNKRYVLYNFQKKYPQLEVKNISVIVSSQYDANRTVQNSIVVRQKAEKTDKRQKLQEIEKIYKKQSLQQRLKKINSRHPVPQQKGQKSTVVADAMLPTQVQDALEKLRQSIIERNK